MRARWWRALLGLGVPNPLEHKVPSSAAKRRAEAAHLATCHAALAFAVVVLALFVGLRPVPTELAGVAPAVAAATILARALVSLGLFAVGLALFRAAERSLPGRGRSLPS